MSSEISVKRTIVEGIAVVISILLAFGIDAAWDGLGDRQAEALYRSSLEVELQSALGSLERKQRISHELDDRLMSFLDRGPLPPDTLRALIRETTFVVNLQLPRAVLDDLVSSGQMQLLRSQGLREGLMRFRNLMDAIAANEDLQHQFVNQRLVSELSGMMPVAALVQIRGYQAESAFLHRASDDQLAELQHDADFQNLMVERLRVLRRGYSAIDRAATLVEELLEELTATAG